MLIWQGISVSIPVLLIESVFFKSDSGRVPDFHLRIKTMLEEVFKADHIVVVLNSIHSCLLEARPGRPYV